MSNSTANLRFASDILQRLGEELIPNPEQGLIELVKNSYDAESKECTVSLENVTSPGGSVIITDKGNGMQKEDLQNGFLIIGRSRKNPTEPTPELGRLPVGDKGLGRLAALRLGHQVKVTSRPKNKPGVEFTLIIDWDKIEAADFIETVDLTISEGKTEEEAGVTITIQNLRKPLSESVIKRLARELLLISDPFKSETDFAVKLQSSEFTKLQKLVDESYFEDADYYLTAKTDELGRGTAELVEISTGNVMATTELPLDGISYKMPSASLELWMFRLSGSANFTSKSTTLQDVRDWIKAFGGVYVYHRNLRVRPYGDPGADWLDMNLSRVSHPELRPSTNNSIGRVKIEDPDLELKQPTSRTGFVDNNAFEDLRRFGQDAIRWSSNFRLKQAEQQREFERKNAPDIKKEAINELKRSLTQLFKAVPKEVPKETTKSIKTAFAKVQNAQKREVISLREDLQLYRSLATAGTTAAVFAHESVKPLALIGTISEVIERRARKHMGEKYDTTLLDPVQELKDIHLYLNVYSQFPIYHLKKIKRQSGSIRVSDVWNSVKDLFMPLLKQAAIKITVTFDDNESEIRGSVALIEAIATNLITNSIHALTRAGSSEENRIINIYGTTIGENIQIIHSDNGPGISLPVSEIWLPGKTTNAQGTGFGLTIVRDSTSDLKGTIEASAHGKLGGAEFKFVFPLIKNTANENS